MAGTPVLDRIRVVVGAPHCLQEPTLLAPDSAREPGKAVAKTP